MNVSEQLRSMFQSGQLVELDAVRSAMLSCPGVLDNHKAKVEDNAKESSTEK